MDGWLKAALDYIPDWLEHQVRVTEQPGCAIAVAHRGEVVLERAFGHANLSSGEALTPRHRLRVASHSKSFTSAGILKLREADRLRLDDPVGRYVDGLHPDLAAATITQVLSHSAGLIRDGLDAGQWQDRRPYLNESQLRSALAEAPVLPASTRFKYSNHGFGLLGLVIQAVTGEPYRTWIHREIVTASGLEETVPDVPVPNDVPFARGHSGKLPLGRRVVVPGDNDTMALSSATGFVSTAGDLARFFASLDPEAERSVLSPESRREMVRKHWHEPHSSLGRHYGLGLTLGQVGDWEWFGHGGGFQSCISRTAALPGRELVVSILTNAVDGLAHPWSDGAIRLLREFEKRGAPSDSALDWTGRWWTLWAAIDLVPAGDHVVVATPGTASPFLDASEIAVTGPDQGTIRLAGGFANHGEGARLVRGGDGKVSELWLGGTKFLPEAALSDELRQRYDN
jgi:CubicO group peptidase (beta-lactamase class C family)